MPRHQRLDRAAVRDRQQRVERAAVDIRRRVEPRDLEVREHVGRDQDAPFRQVQVDLIGAVARGAADHDPPRPDLPEMEPADRVPGRERLEAPRPALLGRAGDPRGFGSDVIPVLLERGREAVVRQRVRGRPPRATEHVIPVRVREDERDGLGPAGRDRARDVVELARQDAGVDDHRVLGVEQHHAVHGVAGAAAHPHAAAEVGPGRAHGRDQRSGTTMAPATISRSSESTTAFTGAGIAP